MEHPKRVLSRYGIHPKQSLGQNFLIDESIVSSIVDAALISKSDAVLEVGAGIGDLTHQLALQGAMVVALEIDSRLISLLHERFKGLHNVQVVQADVLEFVPAHFFPGNFKVVGNLPYYITGAIFKHFYALDSKPEMMVVTVQKEVSQRISALPGRMSVLAVTSQYFAEISEIRNVKAGNFWPKPAVESAVIRLDTRENLPLSNADEEPFFTLVKVGFNQKRKQLQKNLRQLAMPRDHVTDSLIRAGIDGQRRAESLSLAEWIGLFQALYQNVAPP